MGPAIRVALQSAAGTHRSARYGLFCVQRCALSAAEAQQAALTWHLLPKFEHTCCICFAPLMLWCSRQNSVFKHNLSKFQASGAALDLQAVLVHSPGKLLPCKDFMQCSLQLGMYFLLFVLRAMLCNIYSVAHCRCCSLWCCNPGRAEGGSRSSCSPRLHQTMWPLPAMRVYSSAL